MRNTYAPCIPIAGKIVPARPEWLHEIKYDGYRLILVREDKRVRLITRNAHDWSGRFPWIIESALKNRQTHFVIDGEAVVLGIDGVADFNALHSRKCDEEVQLYAFDILALDGEDLRKLPLSMRKTNLDQLPARRPDASLSRRSRLVRLVLISSARRVGLEGSVSKRADRPYRAGRSPDWIKVKNRKHPAMNRVMDALT